MSLVESLVSLTELVGFCAEQLLPQHLSVSVAHITYQQIPALPTDPGIKLKRVSLLTWSLLEMIFWVVTLMNCAIG